MASKRVQFLGDGECDWALFEVDHEGDGGVETLWARVRGERIAFGRYGYRYLDGPPSLSFVDRWFRVAVLRRLLDNGIPTGLGGGQFYNKTRTSVTYETDCGEHRTISLGVLRQIVEDAEGLIANERTA